MKLKAKITKDNNGNYIIKTCYKKGGKKIIRYFTPLELGVSNQELPCIDFRNKILKIIGS